MSVSKVAAGPGELAPRPTPRERAHFSAIARAMAEEKRLQIMRAAECQTADGILVGLGLARLFRLTPEARTLEEHRAAGQIELRRRAIRLRDRKG